MNLGESMVVDVEQIIDITSAPIISVLSYTNSLTKKYTVIGTQFGFCLVNNSKKSFRRFEKDKNPFKKQQNTGVELGAALEQRSQIAVIPSRNSKTYRKTVVYIYDYQLNTILYSNDFFLPIRQLTLTDDTIIVSNNKRIIIYNYSNDMQSKTQEYYLRMYKNDKPNNNIRYLQMNCEQKIMNNSIQQFDSTQITDFQYKECLCGKYAMSWVKPYKMIYAKIFTVNRVKNIQLRVYDWAYDKDYSLGSFAYNEPFSFNISEDGKYIAYSTNQGRNFNIVKFGEDDIFCKLSVSSSIKHCISHGFFYHDDYLWFTVIRKEDKGKYSTGNMHFFRVPKEKNNQLIKSRYSRYFSLFQQTMIDYGICQNLIGPDFYIINGAVYSSSVCGAVVEIIDLKMSGSHAKKNAQNLIKWKQQIY